MKPGTHRTRPHRPATLRSRIRRYAPQALGRRWLTHGLLAGVWRAALGGANAAAICYMEMEHPGGRLFGVGISTNIVAASLEAVVSAANRLLSKD